MLITDIEDAASRLSFVGGLHLWKASTWVERKGTWALLWLRVWVPLGAVTDLSAPLQTSVPLYEDNFHETSLAKISAENDGALKFIVNHLKAFILHEMYESVLVDGKKHFDPHDPDKWHPGSL